MTVPQSPQPPLQQPGRNRSKHRGKRRKSGRVPSPPQPLVDAFRAQHLALAQQQMMTEFGRATITINETESPLVWLARRRGRNGRALIELHQLQAGERLRTDFTQAHLMPRTTANWSNPLSGGRDGGFAEGAGVFTETMIAARQRVHRALDVVGPEFAGLLLDICCFLKGLADVERERAWPARSGKVVLQLALARLARHYGLSAQARGPARAQVKTWLADDAAFGVES